MNRTNVMNEEWDYLLILDACRFDYFERMYHKYLTGCLEYRTSVGSSTGEWVHKTFTENYPDVIYISANPYVNSFSPVEGFSAKGRFRKIFDLWHDNWNEEKQTVLPQVITERAIEIIKAHLDKRAIIHYMQPHEPYLTVDMKESAYDKAQSIRGKVLKTTEHRKIHTLANKMVAIFHGVFYRLGIRDNLTFWRLLQFLGIPPINHMDAVRRKWGKEGLRNAYRENLEMALAAVAELVKHLSGKVVVTSDHGEMLGEGGFYGHPSRSAIEIQLKVPWFIIDKGKRHMEISARTPQPDDTEKPDKETQKEIQEKLRALGYFD